MISDLFKCAIMSPLEEQTAELSVCAKCHKRTLTEKVSNEMGRWMQCSRCLTVYLLPPEYSPDPLLFSSHRT